MTYLILKVLSFDHLRFSSCVRSFQQTGNMVGTAAMVALEDIFYEEIIRRREVALEGRPAWKPLDRRQFERRCCGHGEQAQFPYRYLRKFVPCLHESSLYNYL